LTQRELLITATPGVNLALNKPATQISDHHPLTVASKAVDGNTNGAQWDGYASGTNYHANSWWQIDLQSVQNINSITVWGRTDCCPEMSREFYVFVSDNPFTSYDLNTTINQPGVSNYYHSAYANPGNINVNRTGRYVRVQLNHSQYLVMGEVQVWGGNTGQVQWLVGDHLGTPRMIADQTGSLAGIKRHDYLPFGEEIGLIGGRTGTKGYMADGTKQKFTSYERDHETGLDFAQARYFSSVQGRFTSGDPLTASGITGKPQSWNRYTYSFNNPLRFVDPTGLLPDDYYASRDGTITIYETPGTTDVFYVESNTSPGTFNYVAQANRNAAGLVEFPANGNGFDRYGVVDAGGNDPATGENVGAGDHFVQPIVAAALFGLTNV